ncbi:hypothetical protein C8T65DRAFT_739739 [Cerioporus squamosus]|nr:hypothetical protein C8T65DRAFT_739739 [Cerioporus squamosus]
MTNSKYTVTWRQWVIAASVFATSDADRCWFTYQDFVTVMEAVGFRPHDNQPGTLCPPNRFKAMPNGAQNLCYNACNRPLECQMTPARQDEMQAALRKCYGLELANFTFERNDVWENPADPNVPIPIPDAGLFEDDEW